MKYFFPPQNQNFTYLQTNRSDDLGSLWSTFNLDFQTNLGTMRLSHKLVTNTTSSEDSDLGLPVAFEFFDDRWFAICGTRVFKNSSEQLTSTFTEDASTGAQTNYTSTGSDLELFNGRLWSTTDTGLYSKAAGSGTGNWTSRDSITTGVVHKLAYFKKFNRLYYIRGINRLASIDTADSVASSGDYSLDLTASYGTTIPSLSTIVSTSQYIWIAAIRVGNSSDGQGVQGSIYQWDGISAQVTNEFSFNAGGGLAMTVHNDVPYAIDSQGRIHKFTGYSFEEIARLPIDVILLTNATATGLNRFVHFNGFTSTKNNTLLVLINNLNQDAGATVNENLPSGIWELDLATNNFTHRYSPTLKAFGSGTITDYGQNRISAAGGLIMNTLATNSNDGMSSLMCGFNYFTDATTIKSGIYIDSPYRPVTDNQGQKRGYFVTTWFNSAEIQDKWTRLWTTFRRFLDSTDKIIYKYRLNEEDPTLATITWTSTSTFTTTTNVAAYAPTASGFNGTVGGEVEVLQGTGSGSCTHISSISENGGTYTVTLDTAVTGVSGTAKARFQKWIKLFPEITGQVNSFAQLAIGDSNTRIQIKGVLEWTGNDEFYKMAIFSNEDIKINA